MTHKAAIFDPKEIGGLLRAIDGFSGQPTTHAALRLAPLLFVCPGELRQMEWAEVDFDQAVWTIPAHKAKMRRPHRVPLSRQALAILKEIRAITGQGQYAFPVRAQCVAPFLRTPSMPPCAALAIPRRNDHAWLPGDRQHPIERNGSMERREYIPIGWLEPPAIPSNKLRLLPDATLWEFGVITSRMHMAWTAHIGGRLKSDFQYSIGLNYNAFPWPDASTVQKKKVEILAQAVLDARAAWTTSSLADLYDPDTMPDNLRAAHTKLDAAVDRLYRPSPFASDRDRVEHLFGLYEKMVNPLGQRTASQMRRGGARKRLPRSTVGA